MTTETDLSNINAEKMEELKTIMNILSDHVEGIKKTPQVQKYVRRGKELIQDLQAVFKITLPASELRVLKLMLQGMDDAAIEKECDFAEKTVDVYIWRIIHELGVKSRAEVFEFFKDPEKLSKIEVKKESKPKLKVKAKAKPKNKKR